MSLDEHCKTLGIQPSQKNDLGAIKKALFKKITAPYTYRKDRIKYNLAFQQLCNHLFNTEPSPEQKIIIQAIYKGDIKLLENKFKQNPNLLNFRQKFSNYPLIYIATKSGHYDIVEFILKSGCSLDFSKDRSTPMHCAAYYGFHQIIPLLFKYGIPTKIKNYCDNFPAEEAYSNVIKQLLISAQQNVFSRLVQRLINYKKAIGVLNLSYKEQKGNKKEYQKNTVDVRKIIMSGYFDDYQNYIDSFHGTKFQALESIALHGLMPPGNKINGEILQIVKGHIPLGTKVGQFQDWANAVFVSPSIYYAGDPVYSKAVIIDGETWSPIVQVKVKKGTYSSHDHTLVKYDLKDKQPDLLEFRVKCDQKKQMEKIFRNQDYRNVKVIAYIFVRSSFLFQQDNYKQVSNFMISSQHQRQFFIKNKDIYKKENEKKKIKNELIQSFKKFSSTFKTLF